MQYIYPEKKYVDLHILDGSSVCKKSQNIIKFPRPRIIYILG